MILGSSKSILITLSVIAVLLIAFIGIDIYNIRAKNADTLIQVTAANSASEADVQIRSIRTAQKNEAEDLAAFDNLVLTGNKLVPLIESIEAAGRALGLETHILSVGNIENEEALEVQKIQIVIESQGPWADTFSFLRAIESLPQRVMIEDSDITNEAGSWRSRTVLSLFLFN